MMAALSELPDSDTGVVAVFFAMATGFFFGAWQESWMAGFFMTMFCFVVFLVLSDISKSLDKLSKAVH